LYTTLWALKVTGVAIVGISGQNAIWMWASWKSIEYTIRGEGGGFPQVRAVTSLVSPSVMDRLQTSGELQDKTSFIDPSIGVGLLKGCSLNYLLL